MYKYAIKSIDADLIDCSTYSERDYITGDSDIVLRKWEVKPSSKYFEESKASVKLSALPSNIQTIYSQFEKAVIEYLVKLQ